jgi:hypothetical protein
VSRQGKSVVLPLCDRWHDVGSVMVDGECPSTIFSTSTVRALAASNIGLQTAEEYACTYCQLPTTAIPPAPARANTVTPAARAPILSAVIRYLINKIDGYLAALSEIEKKLTPEEKVFCRIAEAKALLEALKQGRIGYAAAIKAPEYLRLLDCYNSRDIPQFAQNQAAKFFYDECTFNGSDQPRSDICDYDTLREWYW